MNDHYKLPRLYVAHSLEPKTSAPLDEKQAHYLKNVMRKNDGDKVRLFNGQDGEWLGALQNLKKKSGDVLLGQQLRPQPAPSPNIHIYIAPITKSRMDWMIEKLVELGITDIHPVLTQNTEVRKIKVERMSAQIIEAAEQCERLTLPRLHPLKDMIPTLSASKTPVLACLERFEAQRIQNEQGLNDDISYLIGPVGGFTAEEKQQISAIETVTPVSLGQNVLRVETAALYALSVIQSKRET